MAVTVPNNPGSSRESWTEPTARLDWLEGNIEPMVDGVEAERGWLGPLKTKARPDTGYVGYHRWKEDVHGSKVARALIRGQDGQVVGYSRTRLILKGSGLAALRAQGTDDEEAFRRFLEDWSGQAKRLDVAIDVMHPEITPKQFHELHRKRHMVTRLESPRLDGDEDTGQSFYLFAKHGLIRCYDKSAERASKGIMLPTGITRMELELRGPLARRAARDLARMVGSWSDEFPQWACGLLLSKMRPLDGRRPERNPQRAPLWGPLRDVLGDVKTVRLSPEEIERTAMQQVAGQILHYSNDLKSLRLVKELLGPAKFNQAIDQEELSGQAAYLLALMNEKPEKLKQILAERGFDRLGDSGEDGAHE